MYKKIALVLVAFIGLFVLLGFYAGRILCVNQPEKADVIVVLAGGWDDNRYYKGLELLRAGYAPKMYLDALDEVHFYGHLGSEYAARFITESAGADVNRVKVCPSKGDSTVLESASVARCLKADNPRKILLVTSDFHTRRSLSIFRRLLPQYQYAVAATPDIRFGVNWWKHREWAKMAWAEWEKLIFWKTLEQWRSHANS